MHHKFVILDDFLVLTGSFNWSFQAATKNFENIVVTDSKGLIKSYTNLFDKLWNRQVLMLLEESNHLKPNLSPIRSDSF